ncbi:NAD(P)-binding protein [Neoconidiobolus thromboides FSU 785]|nr:NAD(P)-binding protein [Neoconidiobolus thromboides FSU 785]
MLNNAIITGASGLLGRKVYSIFKESGLFEQVIGLAFSRAKNGLIKVDLTSKDELVDLFEKYQPKIVIHCAAERFPDRAEENVDATIKLNIKASEYLAELSKQHGTRLIYISTNYVFDGKNPPYLPSAQPNPLNFYGKSKYEGEKAVVKINPQSIVVRVPILYGETEFPGESMVMLLSEYVKVSY